MAGLWRGVWNELTGVAQRRREREAVELLVSELIAADIVRYCPEHGSAPTRRVACHCVIADEIRRDT